MTTAPKIFHATLTEMVSLSPTVLEITFKPTDFPDFTFDSGQFIMIRMPDEKGQKQARAFSIASPPHQAPEFQLCIRVHEGGAVTPKVAKLKIGSIVEFQGPLGKFGIKKPLDKNTVFIAGGTGISPMRSMVESLLHEETKTKVMLFYSFRDPTDFLFRKELESLPAKYPNFKLCATVTGKEVPQEAWKGCRGRVTEHLKDKVKNPKDTSFYLCGPKEFVEATIAKIQEIGVDKSKIFIEEW
jgi:ferredoxin-NADP reductase